VTTFECWEDALKGVDCVLHLAARAHVLDDTELAPLEAFRRVNVDGTRRLAEAARRSGVMRFVFVSSIGVNGTFTTARPFTEADAVSPVEPYAISKWEAEQMLARVASGNGFELVIVRPPLVYGPGVKGNLRRLLRLVASGVPLPLGSVRNRRSFVGLDNLCDFLGHCVQHRAAGGQTFLLADKEVVSTPQLLRLLARGLDRPARVIPFPPAALRFLAGLAGKAEEIQRLTGSLEVDSSKAEALLGWKPQVSLDAGITEMARWFLRS
jgi:nucleoside-diphosphate-sugar epimerase